MAATAPQPMDLAGVQLDEAAARINGPTALRATPYSFPDPATLPQRQWLMGHWLLRGEVTAIIAPGGTGKSTIGNTIALCLASGQPFLGKPLPHGPQAVWIFNLEDGTDELERQLSAACAYHSIGPDDCGDRLHVDSGLVQPLCTANEDRDGFSLAEDVFAQLETTIRERHIATVIVDPFVSSHAVRESSNEAIDAIAKRWKRLAQETGCAVVLVHHTRKLGDREVKAEDGRGASALPAAARIVLTINPMTKREATEFGIEFWEQRSVVRIDTGKVNRAPPDEATWIKLESKDLGNGASLETSDKVGVARLWHPPEVQGLEPKTIAEIQQRVGAQQCGDNCQANDWVGHVIADVLGHCAEDDKATVKRVQRQLTRDGFLRVEHRRWNGKDRPFVIVGKAVTKGNADENPHFEKCGAGSAESAGADP